MLLIPSSVQHPSHVTTFTIDVVFPNPDRKFKGISTRIAMGHIIHANMTINRVLPVSRVQQFHNYSVQARCMVRPKFLVLSSKEVISQYVQRDSKLV